MITPQTAAGEEIKKDGIDSSLDFGLDATATAHILNMLRSGVYKDPKMACVREYWCNARDSVVEAGKDPSKHVIITLPNSYDPYFKIRDEGLGMSETDVKRVFRKYGASTKRDSNETIGCLGIGSKSAFSYSDTYTVTAIKNGMKCVFIASVARNSVGKDGIGSLNRVLEIETEEPNGVEISIPVKEIDFHEFQTKTCFFMSFLPESERPIVRGVNQSLITIPVRPSVYSDDNWLITNSRNSYAIMGGVPYNLDITAMDGLTPEEKALVGLGVDIRFEIGVLEPAISREELRYTDLTSAALKAEFKKILDFLYGVMKQKQASAKNIWEAKYNYYHLNNIDRFSIEAKIRNSCLTVEQRSSLVWNGRIISSDELDVDPKHKDATVIYLCRMNSGGFSKSLVKSIHVRHPSIPKFVIHDTSRYGEWQRCQGALNTLFPAVTFDSKQFYLIRFDNKEAREDFYTRNEFSTFTTNNLSEFPRDRTQAKAVAKASSRTFSFNHVKGLNQESWKPETLDINVGGVFVELKKFHAFSCGRDFGANKLNNMIEQLKKIGVVVPTVYGFRPSIIAKIDRAKWTDFGTFFKNKVEEFIITNKTFQVSEDETSFNKTNSTTGWNPAYNAETYIQKTIPLITKTDTLFEKFHLAYKAIYLRVTAGNPHADLIQEFEFLGGNTQALKQTKHGVSQEVLDFEKTSSDFIARYPMLKLVYSVGANHQIIADYINLIEK